MQLFRLEEVIEAKKTSGKELAERVGVTPATTSHIINGNSLPKPELLLNNANTLDVDIRESFRSNKDGELLYFISIMKVTGYLMY